MAWAFTESLGQGTLREQIIFAPGQAVDMSRQIAHDGFSIRFFNQGLAAPPPMNAVYSTPPNVDCPYHAAVLRLNNTRPMPEGTQHSRRLEYTPPSSLSHNVRLGTSASCGCTCGHITRDDIRDFVRELDAIVQQSTGQPTVSAST